MIAQTTSFPSYSRIDVGNAIAAIEGDIAINYLLKHNDFNLIDTNHDGLITAQELTNFTNNAAAMGVPEAGAMAALLGGTARIPTSSTATDQFLNQIFIGPYDATIFGEQPDQPDAEQRRYNFFDYNSDGSLNGAISINQFKMLAHTLLPSPTAFSVVDRQRSSTNGYLDNPNVPRNYVALQHIQPTYQFVPKSAIAKYTKVSPNGFGVARNVTPSTLTFPVYELFDGKGTTTVTPTATPATTTSNTSTPSTTTTTTSTNGTTPTGSTAATNPASGTPAPATTTSTGTPAPSTTTPASTASTSSTGSTPGAQSSTDPSTSTTPLNQQLGSAIGNLLTDLNAPPQTAGTMIPASTTPASTTPASTTSASTSSTSNPSSSTTSSGSPPNTNSTT
jgi:hypothetical protein